MINRSLTMVVALIVILGSTALATDRDVHGLLTQNDVATPGVGGGATPQSGSSDDVAIGDTVVFVSDEGDPLANITVDEVINPFTEFAEFFTPEAGSVYIAIRVTVENLDADDDVFQFLTFAAGIQTGDGFFYTPTSVILDEERASTYPAFMLDPIEARGSRSGYLFYAIPNDKDAVRLFYNVPDRLLLLADLPAVEREAPSA